MRVSATGRPWALMVVTDDARLWATSRKAKGDVPRGHGLRLGARGISPEMSSAAPWDIIKGHHHLAVPELDH